MSQAGQKSSPFTSTSAGSATASTGVSPLSPTSISSPSVTTAPASRSTSAYAAPLQPTIPSAETQRHVAEARAAVVASLSNMVDSELQSRASILHENAAALDKQEKEVLRATEGLRREREKLAREADVAARKLKEVGNVQNWAEVLERGFLVLEETVRLANGGSDYDDDEGGGTCSSCSCSDCGKGDLGREEGRDGGDRTPSGNAEEDAREGVAPKDEIMVDVDTEMAGDTESGRATWSDGSRSLTEPESNASTSRAQGSETASTSASI